MTKYAMLEADWQTAAADALDLTGWAWIDTHPTRRASGRWTDENSARGFPDLVACRPPRTLFLELKRSGNTPSTEQADWIVRLQECGQEAHVLTFPQDWNRFSDLIAADPIQMTMTSNSTSSDWLTLTRDMET